MAAKPSTAAEKALQKIQEQMTCGICLKPYKQPKLLKCFHVYCEQCLQCLVRGEAGLPCPQCRKITSLPVGGIPGLQGAFYIQYLFTIHDILKKVSSGDQKICNPCKKHEAVRFCRTCGFVCQSCEEHHQYWDSLKSHDIIDLDTLIRDVTTLIPPLKKKVFCSKHPDKEADLYCSTCNELICRDCIIRIHREHQYDLLSESFSKQEKVILDSLNPVMEQIDALERAVDSVDIQCAAIEQQKTAVMAEVRIAMSHLRGVLKVREEKLVSRAWETAQQKLKTLAAQRDEFVAQLGRLRSCQNFVEESRRTCSWGEILEMKNLLVKDINHLTGSFKPDTLALVEHPDMTFAFSLPEQVKIFKQLGKVYCPPVCPEKCQASGKYTKTASRKKTATLTVEALDREGKPYIRPIDSFSCKLVASDGSSKVRGTVRRRSANIYDISYQPQTTGKHQLHILIQEQPILNSPFAVTVLPNFTAPAKIFGDLKKPWGVAVMATGQLVVAEHGGHCVSIVSRNGKKQSFGTRGLAAGQFNGPKGVAVDARGNILVADFDNCRIQQLSSTGKSLRVSGAFGSKPLQFQGLSSITVHPQSHKVYVAESDNHRIQVLNSDFTFSNIFGGCGCEKGKFNCPQDLSTDSDGNVYVADRYNHRIQVFTADGVYLRQFGKEGEGEGELSHPVNVAIDSHDVVYVNEWGNNRISIFSTDGMFIDSFGRQGKGSVQFDKPYGLALDKKRNLYVCDTGNNRIQIFT